MTAQDRAARLAETLTQNGCAMCITAAAVIRQLLAELDGQKGAVVSAEAPALTSELTEEESVWLPSLPIKVIPATVTILTGGLND